MSVDVENSVSVRRRPLRGIHLGSGRIAFVGDEPLPRQVCDEHPVCAVSVRGSLLRAGWTRAEDLRFAVVVRATLVIGRGRSVCAVRWSDCLEDYGARGGCSVGGSGGDGSVPVAAVGSDAAFRPRGTGFLPW